MMQKKYQYESHTEGVQVFAKSRFPAGLAAVPAAWLHSRGEAYSQNQQIQLAQIDALLADNSWRKPFNEWWKTTRLTFDDAAHLVEQEARRGAELPWNGESLITTAISMTDAGTGPHVSVGHGANSSDYVECYRWLVHIDGLFGTSPDTFNYAEQLHHAATGKPPPSPTLWQRVGWVLDDLRYEPLETLTRWFRVIDHT